MLIWTTRVTALQLTGYAIAIGGLIYYSNGWPAILAQHQALTSWISSNPRFNAILLDEGQIPPTVRRTIIIILGALFTLMLTIVLFVSTGR